MTPDDSKSEAQPVSNNKRRRWKRFVIPLVILLLLAAGVFFYWYEFLRGFVSTDDATIDADAVTIGSKILGRIVALNADEGYSVTPGELLVQLDDSDLKAQEAQAQADIEYVQQNVRLAQIALSKARDDFERDSVQFASGVITGEQFDHTRKALEMAQAQQAVAASQVKASQARLAVIETALQNTKVFASTPGVVAKKWVVPGDIVAPGQPILTLFDLDSVWVTANFEETKLGSIHPGDSVEISVDAYPGRRVMGTVELISAAAASQFSLIPPNNASGNFTKVTQRVPVKIVISDHDLADPAGRPALLPGMSVEVKVRVGER